MSGDGGFPYELISNEVGSRAGDSDDEDDGLEVGDEDATVMGGVGLGVDGGEEEGGVKLVCTEDVKTAEGIGEGDGSIIDGDIMDWKLGDGAEGRKDSKAA
jgi:hypothetical protein